MTDVWVLRSDDSTAVTSRAADGDFVMRLDGDDLEVARVVEVGDGRREPRWLGRMPVRTLPPDARHALDGDEPVAALGQHDTLLTAARGLETALRDRGA